MRVSMHGATITNIPLLGPEDLRQSAPHRTGRCLPVRPNPAPVDRQATHRTAPQAQSITGRSPQAGPTDSRRNPAGRPNRSQATCCSPTRSTPPIAPRAGPAPTRRHAAPPGRVEGGTLHSGPLDLARHTEGQPGCSLEGLLHSCPRRSSDLTQRHLAVASTGDLRGVWPKVPEPSDPVAVGTGTACLLSPPTSTGSRTMRRQR